MVSSSVIDVPLNDSINCATQNRRGTVLHTATIHAGKYIENRVQDRSETAAPPRRSEINKPHDTARNQANRHLGTDIVVCET